MLFRGKMIESPQGIGVMAEAFKIGIGLTLVGLTEKKNKLNQLIITKKRDFWRASNWFVVIFVGVRG